jgi:hypothetical protein
VVADGAGRAPSGELPRGTISSIRESIGALPSAVVSSTGKPMVKPSSWPSRKLKVAQRLPTFCNVISSWSGTIASPGSATSEATSEGAVIRNLATRAATTATAAAAASTAALATARPSLVGPRRAASYSSFARDRLAFAVSTAAVALSRSWCDANPAAVSCEVRLNSCRA